MNPVVIDAPSGVQLRLEEASTLGAHYEDVLTYGALDFLAELHRTFEAHRSALLARRITRQHLLDTGILPDFLPETREIRESDWRVADPPSDLLDRRVEITGPTDRRMTVNALNSGARVWMADFEDSNAPLLDNLVSGQLNLQDAIDRRIDFETPEGRAYRLTAEPAVIVVRPRGWHLVERHLTVDGQPISGSLFDFGLYVYHCAKRERSTPYRPFFYLPKLENHLEARLWNSVLTLAEDRLGLERGHIRATVLIETILAAFEMDEILFELREHAGGLNAGRWDYLFSIIKKLGTQRSEYVLPDRNAVTMTAPFMHAYTELLVSTCHRRGIHAIGGMAAFVPSRQHPEINAVAFDRVREDKEREAAAGFDGSWVAHPDLVPICLAAFDDILGNRPNQIERRRDDVDVSAADLLSISATSGHPTEAGLRNDVSVALQYLEAWLAGRGAVVIYNLMEDVATAEIARSQIWQWAKLKTMLDGGLAVSPELVASVLGEEFSRLAAERSSPFELERLVTARSILEDLVFRPNFVPFLTETAYQHLTPLVPETA